MRNVQPVSSDLDRANFLFREGLAADEAGNGDEAVGIYSEAVELCLKARQQTVDKDLAAKLAKVSIGSLSILVSLELKSRNFATFASA